MTIINRKEKTYSTRFTTEYMNHGTEFGIPLQENSDFKELNIALGKHTP